MASLIWGREIWAASSVSAFLPLSSSWPDTSNRRLFYSLRFWLFLLSVLTLNLAAIVMRFGFVLHPVFFNYFDEGFLVVEHGFLSWTQLSSRDHFDKINES